MEQVLLIPSTNLKDLKSLGEDRTIKILDTLKNQSLITFKMSKFINNIQE